MKRLSKILLWVVPAPVFRGVLRNRRGRPICFRSSFGIGKERRIRTSVYAARVGWFVRLASTEETMKGLNGLFAVIVRLYEKN